jgi:hypothetical protein
VGRRQPPPVEEDAPEWVMHFEYADWVDQTEEPPMWWDNPHQWPSFWEISAWRRWCDAIRAWAAEHGVDLWRLHNPYWETHGHTGTSCNTRCQST